MNTRSMFRLWRLFAGQVVICVLLAPVVLLAADDGRYRRGPERHHPLIVRLGKEGYNTISEFRAALSGKAYREACQIVSASADTGALGLVDDAADRRLLVSLPVAVELAMQDSPALRRAMQEHFDSLGQLRLKQAMAAGNATAVEAIAVQFCGTEAAAEARRWLGDRAISGGRRAQAVGYYKSALKTVAAGQKRDELLNRLRLAGAMMGRDVGRPATTPVQIGQTRFSSKQFEKLVEDTRRAHLSAISNQQSAISNQQGSGRAPAPGQYEVFQWAQVAAEGIKKPGNPAVSRNPRKIDWAARRLAVAVAGRQMIVANQVGLVAFDLRTGRQRWFQRRKAGPHDTRWALMPMHAVVAGSRVFATRLTAKGPELSCLDAADGRLIWSANPATYVASDPLSVGQDLFALCLESPAVRSDTKEELALSVASFDPVSGRVRHQAELAEFRDRCSGVLCCRAVAVDDKIVATAGGCVLCCDQQGRPRWLRRQLWTARPTGNPTVTLRWLMQRHTPPLVIGDRVYATQPGVWNVECLDLDTGRLIWRQAFSELVGLVGAEWQHDSGRIIVETTDGFLALSPDSGKILWQHDASQRLSARLLGQPGGLLYARLVESQDAQQPPRIVLTWLDPATGGVRASSALNTPTQAAPLFGPLVAWGARQWGFFATADEPASRTILE